MTVEILYLIGGHKNVKNKLGGANYSTEEQIVGTWVNGKPLYQKTYTLGSKSITANTDTQLVDLTSLSISLLS